MAYFHSPTIATNGLVLCLDAANGESFRGEPTTNLTTDTPSMNGWQGGYTLVDTNTKTFLIETRQDNAATTSAWRTFYWSVSAYVGQTITISGDVEFVSESNATFRDITIGQGNTGAFPFHINGSDAVDKVVVSTKPINKIRMVWTGVINATGIVGFTQWINNVTANGGNSILRISNVQIEAKSYATPFVNGTRGTTVATGGGFGDLSGNGNNGELVNGTTYNSSNLGSLVFDGVDDWVGIPTLLNSTSIGTSTTLTISIWFNVSIMGDRMIFSTGQTTNDRIYLWTQSSLHMWRVGNFTDTSNQNTISLNKWHFTTLVINGTDISAYLDGVLDYTGTYTPFTTKDYAVFGRHGLNSIYSFSGKIGVSHIYNRPLSAAEVLQNYNATKGRYGL
jgi:hypothetical protein